MRPEVGRPVLCLITDRRRLLDAAGGSESEWPALVLEQVRGAVAGGVDVVQVREHDVGAAVLAAFVRECLTATAGTGVRIIVNDRIDVAIATGADGAHLRESSPVIAMARRITPHGFMLGRSIHDIASAAMLRGADYLIGGSVYATLSKHGEPARLGLDGLKALVRAAGDCPVWAVGGVTAERIPELAARGVRGVAAIGAFVPRSTKSGIAATVEELTRILRFSFDSSQGLT